MARDERRTIGIAWDADPEATAYLVYVDETDDPGWLSAIDAGSITPVATVNAPETEYRFPDGFPAFADVAVVSTDNDGRFSDPYSPLEWQDIPLSRPALVGPTNGRLLFAG